MASNITVDTLTKGGVTLNTDELVDINNTRVCKAWVNFNGTSTVAIRASYNVSSITDNGTGDYTVNFTTAMSDVNYSVSGTGSSPAASTVRAIFVSTSTAPTVSAVRIQSSNYVSAEDSTYVSVQIFR